MHAISWAADKPGIDKPRFGAGSDAGVHGGMFTLVGGHWHEAQVSPWC
jgi:hypothetical protein